MPIDSNKPYPCFDKSNPTIVLGIPDNISRTFGTNKFTFTKANKISRISENPDAWCYIGDYFIHVNNAPWTDKTFLNKIKN